MPTPQPPETAAATFCATLVDEWVRCGLGHAVLSPGSRSTPLALALAADERIRLHVHHDERAAGYLALGLGMATDVPAVVVTTSGTAAVELHPAVVEAHQSRVPMLVCTADRPPELRHVGAPQTIDQSHLYGVAARWFVDPGVPDEATRGTWRSLAGRAVIEATGSVPGPVQLNLPFRDPLVGRPGPLPPGRSEGPWHTQARSAAAGADLATSVAATVSGRRGLIVAGGGVRRPGPVLELAGRLGWPVLADPRSGCRIDDPAVVAHFDSIVRLPHAPRPEVVLRLGSPPASKALSAWLATSDAHHIAVDEHGGWFDPDHDLGRLVVAEPGELCAEVLTFDPAPAEAGWSASWRESELEARKRIADVLAATARLCDPEIARAVLAAAPEGSSLVVSSSMPVRDLEWYGAPRSGVRVLANRGANGIDGVVSTAVGVALAGVATTALVGDVAFLHDTNALLGLADRGVDLVVVVADNDGGAIFSFLPQAELVAPETFERLFGTPHGVDLAALASVHGIDAVTVTDQADLVTSLGKAHAAGGVHVVVARTDRAANVAVHTALDGMS